MNNKNLSHEESRRIEHDEDEIELIDILRVMWKWKYFIIGGALICGLIVAIASFNMNKIYSVDMTLRPGILSIGEQGEYDYIDSSNNGLTYVVEAFKNENISSHITLIKGERSELSELATNLL